MKFTPAYRQAGLTLLSFLKQGKIKFIRIEESPS